MDPELKKLFDELRAELGKNVDALKRVDDLAARAESGQAEIKAMRAEVDKIRAFVEERDKQIEKLREQGRVEALRRDPIRERSQGLEMLGMIARQEWARQMRS